MNLIAILLITMSILTLLSGFIVLIGAYEEKRSHVVPYFLTTISAAVWGISMVMFLGTKSGDTASATTYLIVMHISALVCATMLCWYIGWKKKFIRLLVGIAVLATICMSVLLIIDPSRMFAKIDDETPSILTEQIKVVEKE